jgi:hypothetical protein
MPVIQSGTQLYTYSDAVQYICDAHAVDRTGLNERHARAAIQFAYRDLPSRHEWTYLYRQRLIQTVASYSTGTVEFDYTGGANERMLTLTTGTWPSWATYGRVIIDGTHYEVEDRKSDSIITLSETSNPGADVASGTTYTLYRNSYPLPANFRRFVALWDVAQYPIHFVDQRQQHTSLQGFFDTPGTPCHATYRNTGKYLGGTELLFGPPPSTATTYDLLYEASPRPLTIDEYSAGTVSVTSGDATVTGVSTTFPTTCVGAIIRFSAGPVKPTSEIGALSGADNPFVLQGVIKERTSATVLELEEAPTQSLSGVAYTISDPLDLEPHTMLTPFLRMAEAEFSRRASRQDAKAKDALARQALLEAMEADSKTTNQRGPYLYDPLGRVTVTNSA